VSIAEEVFKVKGSKDKVKVRPDELTYNGGGTWCGVEAQLF